MIRYKVFLLCGLLASLVFLSGCAGKSAYGDVEAVNPAGSFSNTDIRLLADTIISDLLAAPFIARYEQPVTISMLHIGNKTSEFIDTDALVGDKIMMAIINSGSGVFEFVDRALLEQTIAEAELGADGLVVQDEATRLGRAAGVTLLMTGDLSSIRQVSKKTDQRWYRLSLKLVDCERNTVVWGSEKEIIKETKKGFWQ